MRDVPVCEIVISYKALYNEPNPEGVLDGARNPAFIIPPDKNAEPFELAERLAKEYANKSVCILVPGTCFDKFGTRHGKGGGWYDRLLSKIPKEWTRIGVCFETDYSTEKLIRKEWDQPVDWLALFSENGVEIIKTNENRT